MNEFEKWLNKHEEFCKNMLEQCIKNSEPYELWKNELLIIEDTRRLVRTFEYESVIAG